jgi:CO/xanthine dehydrogenase FAD-binding subunit
MDEGRVRLGAGVPYARVIDELGTQLPGLAMASRTVGSPQIRMRGTVGGNLGSASPAGDAHPPLLAAEAVVEVESAARGTRLIPAADFYTGVKRNALEVDELIAAVLVAPAAGPEQFCKVGTRNAMVIAVSAFACALHPDRQAVGTGIGSAAPTPRRALEAEKFLAGELSSAGLWESRGELPDSLARAFGERVAAAASPIDDVRGSAAYRRHSLSVMARRAVTWAWNDLRKAA